MSDPTSKHKPYTTGAEPSTTADKANVHMSGSGWVRTITATDHAWAGNDDTGSDPEILVAFRGHGSYVGWYAYSFWVGALSGISAGTFNGGGTISIHAHFNENVDVNTSGGTPTMTITNNQTGGGSAATLTASYASGSGGHVLTFTTAAGTSGQLVSGNTIHIGANPFALNSGTIFEAGTSNPPTLTASSDVGNQGTYNKGGDRSHTNAAFADGSRVRIKA